MITVEDIRKFTLFKAFPTESLASMIPRLVCKTYPANTTIIYRGVPAYSMFMIISGQVAATLIDDKGSECILSIMNEGDVFGEIALLTGEPRTANVKSITDVRVIELSQDIFNELRERYPELNSAFFRLLAQRIGNKDIHQQLEEKLKESEQRLYNVIQGSPIPAFVIGKDHRVLYWNKALEELTRIKAEEVVGTNRHWWAFYAEERPCMADLLVDQKLEAIPQWYFEKYLKSQLIKEAYEAADFFPRLGDTGKWLHFTAAAIRDTQGDLVGAIETLEDVTARKRAEEELIRVEKLESLGIFAGGIAHDFNKLISIMLYNIFTAKLSLADEQQEVLGGGLETAEKAGLQAKELAHRLVTFAKGGESIRKTGDISQLLMNSIDLSLSGSNVICEFSFPNDLWPAEMDDVQIRQVIHNLVVNALEAMPKGGTITIHAENVNATVGNGLPLKEGKYVKWSVKDHGIGIPKEDLQKIFDPYFTTKPTGTTRGMGLGLAICYSIIKKHNGFINVESEPGVGSTFFVYLPASPQEGDLKKDTTEQSIARGGRILVMDDEETVRSATGVVLNYLGYDVEYAKNGNEAVELYRTAKEKKQPFSAVILDLNVLDGMGGEQAMKELLAIDPHVKAIITCGYSNDSAASELRNSGICWTVDVPYDIEKMKEILNNLPK